MGVSAVAEEEMGMEMMMMMTTAAAVVAFRGLGVVVVQGGVVV